MNIKSLRSIILSVLSAYNSEASETSQIGSNYVFSIGNHQNATGSLCPSPSVLESYIECYSSGTDSLKYCEITSNSYATLVSIDSNSSTLVSFDWTGSSTNLLFQFSGPKSAATPFVSGVESAFFVGDVGYNGCYSIVIADSSDASADLTPITVYQEGQSFFATI